jgi:cardiolipin synthase
MVAVLMDNRQPAKTVAWVMVLSFIPVVGVIIYFFFGQNFRKERIISQRSLDELTKRSMLEFAEQRNLHLPEHSRQLLKLFANQSMALPFKDNSADIYTDGYDFFLSLLRDIGRAQDHIHIDTYIIENDALGRLLCDALIDKARQGVEVRLIYDDVGCWRVKDRFFDRMRKEGVKVQPFMPVRFPALTGKVNYRNHRKICIIDGEIGFIGGMNIAMRYIKGESGRPWRDTHLRIVGGAVYALQRAFLIDWYFVDSTLITDHRYYPNSTRIEENNCLAQLVTSSPIQPWPDIMQGYVKILLEAKKYVYMETPYFLPTEPILFAMRTAALSGVDVRLMVPMHGDAKLVEWACKSYLGEVVEAGVKVYLYEPGFNHSKIMVSDDYLSTCGSTNIDFRSFENNFEANIFFYDNEMALRIKNIYLEDEKYCIDIEELRDFTHRSFVQRLWESLVRLLSPLL